MHKHNSDDCKMMWLMMLPCLLMPLIFIFLSGKGPSAPNWNLFIGIVFMVSIHWLMMKFMHRHCQDSTDDKINDKS